MAVIQLVLVVAVVLSVMLPIVRRLRHVHLIPVNDIGDAAVRKTVQGKLEEVAKGSNGDVRLAQGNQQLVATTYSRSWNLALCLASSTELVLLLIALVRWLRCVHRARQNPRQWTKRRQHVVLEAGLKAVVVIVSAAFDVMFAVQRLVHPRSVCGWSTTDNVAACFSIFLFVALTVLLLLDASGPTPVKGRRGVVVKDLPYRHHWFKFVVLLVGAGTSQLGNKL